MENKNNSRKGLLNQLGDYLDFMKASGVDYLPRHRPPADREELTAPTPPAADPTLTERPAPSATPPPSAAADGLEGLRAELADCSRCRLGQTRTRLVFGSGNPRADLLFVGEGPGRDEDLAGEPFVGKAGELLTRIIEAIKLKREEVYICNVVKCRPPDNRNPLPDEIAPCEPFLRRQIELVHPKVICALGKVAAQTLLKTDAPISTLRGRFHDLGGIPLMPTYHPAYLLRNPGAKREVWADMQMIQRRLQG